jgi:hypothetical protein
MRWIWKFLHHKSLTVSCVALTFALLAVGALPIHSHPVQELGIDHSTLPAIVALLGLLVCGLTLVVLLKDGRSNYPPLRLSLATMLWALSCAPVVVLAFVVGRGLLS